MAIVESYDMENGTVSVQDNCYCEKSAEELKRIIENAVDTARKIAYQEKNLLQNKDIIK